MYLRILFPLPEEAEILYINTKAHYESDYLFTYVGKRIICADACALNTPISYISKTQPKPFIYSEEVEQARCTLVTSVLIRTLGLIH